MDDPNKDAYGEHYRIRTTGPEPRNLLANILDHWDRIAGDTKQDIKDLETGFYNAVESLRDWLESE